MSKKQRREEDELDRALKEIRELKAVNRSLMKRLKKVDRDAAEEIEKALRSIEEEYARTEGVRSVPCEHCGKGNITVVDIVGRKFESCTACDYRRKIPKGG